MLCLQTPSECRQAAAMKERALRAAGVRSLRKSGLRFYYAGAKNPQASAVLYGKSQSYTTHLGPGIGI